MLREKDEHMAITTDVLGDTGYIDEEFRANRLSLDLSTYSKWRPLCWKLL